MEGACHIQATQHLDVRALEVDILHLTFDFAGVGGVRYLLA